MKSVIKFNPTISIDGVAAIAFGLGLVVYLVTIRVQLDQTREDFSHLKSNVEIQSQSIATLQASIAVLNALKDKQ